MTNPTLIPYETIARIAQARADKPKLRDRDLADLLHLSEAHLLAAELGDGVARIMADPARLMPHVCALGQVMALTRNDWCVHESRGEYVDFHAGDHASMVLGPEIDLRIFPRHWVHAFAVTRQGEAGPRRSVQVFDAAGDAVHKVHLSDASKVAAFDALVADLALPADAPFDLTARAAPEPVRVHPDKIDTLREGWAKMTVSANFSTQWRFLGRFGPILFSRR